jgi:hypothetical protein
MNTTNMLPSITKLQHTTIKKHIKPIMQETTIRQHTTIKWPMDMLYMLMNTMNMLLSITQRPIAKCTQSIQSTSNASNITLKNHLRVVFSFGLANEALFKRAIVCKVIFLL